MNSVLARLPVVTRWLDEARPDVLCMQETKCTDERFPAEAFAELGYKAKTFGQPTYNGVAVLSKADCDEVHRGFPDDDSSAQARLLAVVVRNIHIVNVYIPNGQSVGAEKYYFKLAWMKRLRAYFDEYYKKNSKVLLCGDFNVAPEERDVHNPELWEGRILFSEKEREALELIKDWGFIDAFRMHTEEGGHYSWWDYRAMSFRRNNGLRIDHIWVSKSLAATCTGAWIDKEPRKWERPSDHTPVVAEFD